MDSGESSLNRIRIVSTLIRAHIRTVSALDVNQILCQCLWCVIPYHASDYSASACTDKNLRSPSSLQSYRDLVAVHLPFPCWLTNLPAAPQGQAPDSVMGLRTQDQNWGLEPGGTNLGSKAPFTERCRGKLKILFRLGCPFVIAHLQWCTIKLFGL